MRAGCPLPNKGTSSVSAILRPTLNASPWSPLRKASSVLVAISPQYFLLSLRTMLLTLRWATVSVLMAKARSLAKSGGRWGREPLNGPNHRILRRCSRAVFSKASLCVASGLLAPEWAARELVFLCVPSCCVPPPPLVLETTLPVCTGVGASRSALSSCGSKPDFQCVLRVCAQSGSEISHLVVRSPGLPMCVEGLPQTGLEISLPVAWKPDF